MGSSAVRRAGAALAVAACLASVAVLVAPESARASAEPDLVSDVPATTTPAVLDDGTNSARVLTVAKVGGRVVVGGSFSQVADPGGAARPAANLLVFDPDTGAITALPEVDGTVETLLKGPRKHTVYVGGDFDRVNGRRVSNLVLLDVRTGARVKGFVGPELDNRVTDLARVGEHLLVGGRFRQVDASTLHALVSLDATTGEPDGWVDLSVTGHHNWRASDLTAAKGPLGVTRMQLTPDRSRLVVIGNFRFVDGLPRDQIALLNLTGKRVRVHSWATTALTSPCRKTRFDSWVRDVDVSADGSYAVVVSSGGSFPGTLCDAAARFELRSRAPDVEPTWVASSGGDSLWSVALDERAVYVGGHMRWMNNADGSDEAQQGAVPRASLAALDPGTGLPWSWNPGRHPRGFGVTTLRVTSLGLLVGSDTDYLGASEFLRPRLALLPTVGGSTIPDQGEVADPAVYRAGAPDLAVGDVARHHVTPSGVDATWPEPLTTAVDWATVRGAFTTGMSLWTASADGRLARHTFDGASVGPAVLATPWAEQPWADQQTGSRGTQTYLGRPSTLHDGLAEVRALTYTDGALLYLVDGSGALHRRAFNPESGIVADRSDVVRDVTLPTSTTGLVARRGFLYVADEDGTLTAHRLRGAAPDAVGIVVSGPAVDGLDWSAAVLFAGPSPSGS